MTHLVRGPAAHRQRVPRTWCVRTAVTLTLLVLGLTALTGCSASPRATPPGRFAAATDLSGQTIVVGGKEFTEQLVLCKMTIALLQSAGATVVDRCNTQGSANVRAALVTGQIDLYWEYTGTAWRTYLNQTTPIADPRTLWAAVRDADAGNQVAWLEPTPFDDTYAIGVRTDVADRLRIRSLSDLSALVASGSPEASLCVAPEFTGREDGLQGLLRTYGLRLPTGRLTTRNLDDVYPALAAASPCTFGEVFATDGRLNGLRLTTLVDDKAYFLPYNAAPTVRADVLSRAPELASLGTVLAPLLTADVVRGLNEQVTSRGQDADTVARTFLRSQGLTG